MSILYSARERLVLCLCAAIALFVMGGSPMAQEVDMEKIFTCEDQSTLPMEECDAGRKILLDNCTACHAFVQIVIRQYDEGGWTSVLRRHEERVAHLTKEDLLKLRKYLAAKFNPDREPPELPAALLEAMTDY